MDAQAQTVTLAEPATVQAPLHYLANLDIKPVSHNPPPGEGGPYRDGNYHDYTVAISDARAAAHDFSIDREGFELVRHETEVRDFYDDDEVRAVYDLEVEHLLKQATGASRVVVFDHTRRATGGSDEGGSADRAPVRLVHNDYTETSGPQRVRDLLGDGEADELLKHRFAEINVWRPIHGPVQSLPLALADSSSIAPGDLVAVDLVYEDRTGEIYHGLYNPDHRWYYFPQMATDEAILIKCFDSALDGRARFNLHTAFDDPTTPDGAPARESIETRALVFFDD
jgi:hypothetical protein